MVRKIRSAGTDAFLSGDPRMNQLDQWQAEKEKRDRQEKEEEETLAALDPDGKNDPDEVVSSDDEEDQSQEDAGTDTATPSSRRPKAPPPPTVERPSKKRRLRIVHDDNEDVDDSLDSPDPAPPRLALGVDTPDGKTVKWAEERFGEFADKFPDLFQYPLPQWYRHLCEGFTKVPEDASEMVKANADQLTFCGLDNLGDRGWVFVHNPGGNAYKSQLVKLMVKCEGALFINTNVVRKGADAVSFMLANKLADMQMSMLLNCPYANPFEDDDENEGEEHANTKRKRFVTASPQLSVHSFKNTDHIAKEELWRVRADCRLYKWQAGGCKVFIDIERSNNIIYRTDLYSMLESLNNHAVQSPKYQGFEFEWKVHGFHQRARAPACILLCNEGIPVSMFGLRSPIGPDRLHPLYLDSATGKLNIEYRVKTLLAEQQQTINMDQARKTAENDAQERSLLAGCGGTSCLSGAIGLDSLKVIYLEEMTNAWFEVGLDADLWERVGGIFDPGSTLPSSGGKLGGFEVDMLIHGLFKHYTIFTAAVQHHTDAEYADGEKALAEKKKLTFNPCVQWWFSDDCNERYKLLLDKWPENIDSATKSSAYDPIFTELRNSEPFWRERLMKCTPTPDAYRQAFGKVVTPFVNKFKSGIPILKRKATGFIAQVTPIVPSLTTGGAYVKRSMVDNGAAAVTEAEVINVPAGKMMDIHAAQVVCYLICRHVAKDLPKVQGTSTFDETAYFTNIANFGSQLASKRRV